MYVSNLIIIFNYLTALNIFEYLITNYIYKTISDLYCAFCESLSSKIFWVTIFKPICNLNFTRRFRECKLVEINTFTASGITFQLQITGF